MRSRCWKGGDEMMCDDAEQMRQQIDVNRGSEIVIHLMEDDEFGEDYMVSAAEWISDTIHILGFDRPELKNYRSKTFESWWTKQLAKATSPARGIDDGCKRSM